MTFIITSRENKSNSVPLSGVKGLMHKILTLVLTIFDFIWNFGFEFFNKTLLTFWKAFFILQFREQFLIDKLIWSFIHISILNIKLFYFVCKIIHLYCVVFNSTGMIRIVKLKEVMQTQQPILMKTVLSSKPENIVKETRTGHSLVMVKRTRVKGYCVECIKRKSDPMYKKTMPKIITHCPMCPGGDWICEPCFDRTHANL